MRRLLTERDRGGCCYCARVEKLNDLDMALFGETGQRGLLKLMLVELLSCRGAGRPVELGSSGLVTVGHLGGALPEVGVHHGYLLLR